MDSATKSSDTLRISRPDSKVCEQVQETNTLVRKATSLSTYEGGRQLLMHAPFDGCCVVYRHVFHHQPHKAEPQGKSFDRLRLKLRLFVPCQNEIPSNSAHVHTTATEDVRFPCSFHYGI